MNFESFESPVMNHHARADTAACILLDAAHDSFMSIAQNYSVKNDMLILECLINAFNVWNERNYGCFTPSTWSMFGKHGGQRKYIPCDENMPDREGLDQLLKEMREIRGNNACKSKSQKKLLPLGNRIRHFF